MTTATNIVPTRNGRNLDLEVGGELTVTIRPATGTQGVELLRFLAELNAANFADTDTAALAVEDATTAYQMALGDTDDDHPALDVIEQLRGEEAQHVFTAAILWNARGGSFANVEQYLADGDHAAALTRLLINSGFVTVA